MPNEKNKKIISKIPFIKSESLSVFFINLISLKLKKNKR